MESHVGEAARQQRQNSSTAVRTLPAAEASRNVLELRTSPPRQSGRMQHQHHTDPEAAHLGRGSDVAHRAAPRSGSSQVGDSNRHLPPGWPAGRPVATGFLPALSEADAAQQTARSPDERSRRCPSPEVLPAVPEAASPPGIRSWYQRARQRQQAKAGAQAGRQKRRGAMRRQRMAGSGALPNAREALARTAGEGGRERMLTASRGRQVEPAAFSSSLKQMGRPGWSQEPAEGNPSWSGSCRSLPAQQSGPARNSRPLQ